MNTSTTISVSAATSTELQIRATPVTLTSQATLNALEGIQKRRVPFNYLPESEHAPPCQECLCQGPIRIIWQSSENDFVLQTAIPSMPVYHSGYEAINPERGRPINHNEDGDKEEMRRRTRPHVRHFCPSRRLCRLPLKATVSSRGGGGAKFSRPSAPSGTSPRSMA